MNLIDFILHIDSHLVSIVTACGNWTYLILFAIIFIETGIVIFPFLPGDSLIFAACAMAASPKYNINFWICYLVFVIAAILGDTINYEIGRWSQATGEKHNLFNKLINEDKKKATENFFKTHGGITVAIGRFIPFIRTFVPFVSGASNMHYRTFIIYNLIGGVSWVTLFAALGYFFGNIQLIQNHFSLIVLAIILISVIPMLILWLKKKIVQKKELH